VEDSGADLQDVQDLEDDELEHGAGESEVDAENQLKFFVEKIYITCLTSFFK
jgi:hypothetical protein